MDLYANTKLVDSLRETPTATLFEQSTDIFFIRIVDQLAQMNLESTSRLGGDDIFGLASP